MYLITTRKSYMRQPVAQRHVVFFFLFRSSSSFLHLSSPAKPIPSNQNIAGPSAQPPPGTPTVASTIRLTTCRRRARLHQPVQITPPPRERKEEEERGRKEGRRRVVKKLRRRGSVSPEKREEGRRSFAGERKKKFRKRKEEEEEGRCEKKNKCQRMIGCACFRWCGCYT
ncbi:hypothetical protein ACLB2K_012069 [Fragaria x ananassa]